MKLVFITDDVTIDPDDVSSIQREELRHCTDTGWPSGNPTYTTTFIGSVVTLKNGRKIYVPNQTPKEIHEKLKSNSEATVANQKE